VSAGVLRARVISRLPTSLKCETAACSFADFVYVVALGKNSDEIWRYRLRGCGAVRAAPAAAISGGPRDWTLCARLETGRRRHCVATVGRQLYVLAGIAAADQSTVLDSVEVRIVHAL